MKIKNIFSPRSVCVCVLRDVRKENRKNESKSVQGRDEKLSAYLALSDAKYLLLLCLTNQFNIFVLHEGRVAPAPASALHIIVERGETILHLDLYISLSVSLLI